MSYCHHTLNALELSISIHGVAIVCGGNFRNPEADSPLSKYPARPLGEWQETNTYALEGKELAVRTNLTGKEKL